MMGPAILEEALTRSKVDRLTPLEAKQVRVKLDELNGEDLLIWVDVKATTDWIRVEFETQAASGLLEILRSSVADLADIRDKASPPRNGILLTLASVLLPCPMRDEWLEEQRSYVADQPDRRSRLIWRWQTLTGMPRYAYTVRTGIRKESA